MNRQMMILGAAGAVLAVAMGLGGYWLGQHAKAATSSAPPAFEAGRRVLYWHDPMVPGQRFDKPGKSPYMDMQLVPVYADGQAAVGTVMVSPNVRQNLGIRYVTVREGSVASGQQWVGNVAYDERDRVLVSARAAGYIERQFVRAPLESVRQGQALFALYVPEWVAAQEDYLAIQRMAAPDARLRDAAVQRMRQAGMTDGQIRQVTAQERVQRTVTVVAPAAGVVSELAAREGMTVAVGAPLAAIDGLRRVWVNAEVPEGAAAGVRPGSAVRVTAVAYPGEIFDGKVEALLPQVNAATRTLVARVAVANPGGKLMPGMFANVSMAAREGAPGLLVPSEAVIRTGTRSVVIVADDEGRFHAANVVLGAEAGGQTEVRSGVHAGQRVVASGQFLIDSEASLRGALRRMEGAPAGNDAGGRAPSSTDRAPAPSNDAPAPARAFAPASVSASASVPASAPAAVTAPAPAAVVHRGHGRIERVAGDEVTISHGPIPSLKWGPMTMDFVAPPSGLPAEAGVGAVVDFEIRIRPDHRYQITSLRVQGAHAHAGDPR